MQGNRTTDSPAVAYSYIRFSTPDQAKGDSQRRQMEAAAAWCKRNNARLDTSLKVDKGISAFKGRNADLGSLGEFLKLVQGERVPRGSFLVVESLDRLTREDVQPALRLILGLTGAGIRIVQLSPVEIIYDDKSDAMAIVIMIMELMRGNSESKVKSERVGEAWKEKKACARQGKPQPPRKQDRVNNMTLLTHCVPAWIEERNGKLELIADRAAIVKRIFHLAANGYGRKLIVRAFIKDKVPPIGEADHWNASYVGAILKDRRALGEYQPKRQRGREADGDPIPGYYPAVVTDEEWTTARAGVVQRQKKRGRTSNHVNVFANLLKNALDGDSYHCVLRMASKGRGKKGRILLNNGAREGWAKCRSFPFDVFEQAILCCLRGINPNDILEGNNEPDETLTLGSELALVESELAEAGAFMDANGFSTTIGKRVTVLEARKRDLVEKLAVAKQKAAHPVSESWGEAQTLIGALDTAPDQDDARIRLRGVLRRVVESIWMFVVPRGLDRWCVAQVFFHESGKYQTYLILYRAARANGKARVDAKWYCRSFADVAGEGDKSLKDPITAALWAKLLEKMPLAAIIDPPQQGTA